MRKRRFRTASIAVLRTINSWEVIVPRLVHAPDRPSFIAYAKFPPVNVSPYTFDEAVSLLFIANSKWAPDGKPPPLNIEPIARQFRGCYVFSLRQLGLIASDPSNYAESDELDD